MKIVHLVYSLGWLLLYWATHRFGTCLLLSDDSSRVVGWSITRLVSHLLRSQRSLAFEPICSDAFEFRNLLCMFEGDVSMLNISKHDISNIHFKLRVIHEFKGDYLSKACKHQTHKVLVQRLINPLNINVFRVFVVFLFWVTHFWRLSELG